MIWSKKLWLVEYNSSRPMQQYIAACSLDACIELFEELNASPHHKEWVRTRRDITKIELIDDSVHYKETHFDK